MEGLVIREGREEDLQSVLRLWLQMADLHSTLDPRLRVRTDAEGQEGMRSHLRTLLGSADSRLFVAEVAGVEGLAGYLMAHIRTVSPIACPPTCGHVGDICVDERLRRGGIGRALLQAAREWFRERGQTVARLSVAVSNPVSQAFWRAMGATELMLLMSMEV